ncbi:MAG: PIG-L family deacetylase [Anaerolineales bacterium]|nr:PIG-L family deacetylase [Anaerolineales bacterium]
MRYIYLSPHLDDASLSAGGWIYEQTQKNIPVEIWTIMCGYPPDTQLSPFAQYMHNAWGMETAEQVVRGRRLEDLNSAKILGATAQHFDFLDCIYRRDVAGNWLYDSIFIDPLPQEEYLPKQIADEILSRLKPDDKLVAQFGIGKHVDHVIVRQAVELLNQPILYVADIPYLFNTPEHLDEHKAGMKEKVDMVSETGIRSWIEAVAAYESQILALFESHEAMRNKIREYCLEHNGLRFWSK